MNRTRIITVAAAALVLGSIAGCSYGGGDAVDGQASPVVATEAEAPAAAQAAGVALAAVDSPALGKILTDASGMTLYRFDEDTAKPPKSNCDGECAAAWPPVLATSDEVQADGVEGEIGTVARSDGDLQVTVAGWPLYRYAGDAKPGDTNGQGAGGRWFAATPQGKKAIAGSAAPAGSPGAAGTGGGAAAAPAAPPAALVVMKVGALGSIVTDREGMTLYRFDKDTAKPSKSNCEGDCAVAWPPLLTSSANIEVTGVDKALVGTVTRADGSLQVTIAGWPVYRFAKDTKPCDTNGQGVGGVWFAITPQGKKAGV